MLKIPGPFQNASGFAEAVSARALRLRHNVEKLDQKSALAVVDQAVVSGMSLVASVLVGRACGAEGLGLYSLSITIVILFTGLHTALISAPYTVFRSRIGEKNERRFAGSVLIASFFVSLLVVGLLTCAFVFFFVSDVIPTFATIVATLTLMAPFLILREFLRRFNFAHLRMVSALAIDLSVAAIQLTSLCILAWFEILTPAVALICLGASAGLTGLIWLVRNRQHFSVDRQLFRADLSKQWIMGRWLAIEQVVTTAGSHIIPWLLIFLIDSRATGILAACLVIVNLSSPYLQGMGNSLAPKFAAAAATNTRQPIRRLFRKSTAFLVFVMACFAAFCLLAGELLIQLVFRDEAYGGYGWVVAILAIRAMCGSPIITSRHALLAMESPLPTLYCSIAGLAGTLVLGLILIPLYGITGGAVAMLLGTMLETIVVCLGYLWRLKTFGDESAAPRSGAPN